MSFGYEIMATLLQLGVATSIIANGGYQVQPLLVRNAKETNRKARQKLYSDQAIQQTQSILTQIGSRYPVEGVNVMGKTGTARLIENNEYSDQKHIHTFAGIVEKGDYRRVIVTFVREPKNTSVWASQVATPLFQNVAEKMIIHDMLS